MSDFIRFALQRGRVSSDEQCRLVNELASAGPGNASILLSALKHEHPRVRDSAARAFGRLAIVRADVTQALLFILNDDDVEVRQAAAVALSMLPPLPSSAKSILALALDDEDENVSLYVKEVLYKIEALATAPVAMRQSA
jgi:HEAT repeat protein